MDVCFHVYCLYEIVRLREDVNPIIATFALQAIPPAAAQTFTPTLAYFPVHVEALIIITFLGVIILVLPVISRAVSTTYRKIRPRPRQIRHRPSYQELISRATLDSGTAADVQMSTIAEEAGCGPAAVLIDNQPQPKSGPSGIRKK